MSPTKVAARDAQLKDVLSLLATILLAVIVLCIWYGIWRTSHISPQHVPGEVVQTPPHSA